MKFKDLILLLPMAILVILLIIAINTHVNVVIMMILVFLTGVVYGAILLLCTLTISLNRKRRG